VGENPGACIEFSTALREGQVSFKTQKRKFKIDPLIPKNDPLVCLSFKVCATPNGCHERKGLSFWGGIQVRNL
jgi:hypothetical protein